MIEFLDEISSLKENWQMRQDGRLMNVCSSLENDLNNLIAVITGRFESFNRNTDAIYHRGTLQIRSGADYGPPFHNRRRGLRLGHQDECLARIVSDRRYGRSGKPG